MSDKKLGPLAIGTVVGELTVLNIDRKKKSVGVVCSCGLRFKRSLPTMREANRLQRHAACKKCQKPLRKRVLFYKASA